MRFWRGLLWGGLIGSAVGLVLSGKKRKKRTALQDRFKTTAGGMLQSAGKIRRRMMRRLRD
ncbi:MAG TPA: hypothetical protein VN462_08930 [Negativicutes bacterium]|nr:hypothetical protein [Negativicutes bacterium]